MAIISGIINKVCNSSGGSLGLNLSRGSLQSFSKPEKVIFMPRGFEFDKSSDFGEEYLDQLKLEGKIDIISNISSSSEVGNDDNYDTKESGIEFLIQKGLYKLQFNRSQGLYSQKQLASISGFGRFDIGLMDQNGNFLFTETRNGSFKGFTTGEIQVGKYSMATGQSGEESMFTAQLIERNEFDEAFVYIPECEYNGNTKFIEGVNQVRLSFVNTPAVGDTTLTFKAVLDQDGVTNITALDDVDRLRVRINNTVVNNNPSPTSNDGEYTVSIPALSLDDKIDAILYNTTDSQSRIMLDNNVYQSKLIQATAA